MVMPTGRDQTTGQFLPGNRLWEARSSAGPKPKFEHGEVGAAKLRKSCTEYFEWVEVNPLHAGHVVSFQGDAKIIAVPKMRAMTVMGLCIFLDIHIDTWIEWRKSRSDLSDVIAGVEQVIRTQKFEGASADLLNANIISRELGLADKQELTGKDGGSIQVEDRSAIEEARLIAFALAKAGKIE